ARPGAVPQGRQHRGHQLAALRCTRVRPHAVALRDRVRRGSAAAPGGARPGSPDGGCAGVPGRQRGSLRQDRPDDGPSAAVKASGIALRILAGAYLAGVWLDGVGSTLPSHLLPRVPNYFLQIAALFPRAATMSIDYRAEAW